MSTDIPCGPCRGDWHPIAADWNIGVVIAASPHLPNEFQMWRCSCPVSWSEANWPTGEHWRGPDNFTRASLEDWRFAASAVSPMQKEVPDGPRQKTNTDGVEEASRQSG